MKSSTAILWFVIIVAIAGTWYWFGKTSTPKNLAVDYKNATYMIDGKAVTLKDGVSEIETDPGSASKLVTRYFGNEAKGDINGDGMPDLAFLLTQSGGGSGTFYYVAAAIQDASGGYRGTSGVLLGDRIAPQTTEIRDGQVIVNYAERAPGESFATPPSVGKSMWLKLDPKTMQFGEVVQNFEGEADPARMTLGMQTWNWIKTIYNDDRTVIPNETKKFTITFKDGKTFSATTDCNGVGGEYSVSGDKITFTQMMSTLRYCQNSQEQDFTKMLDEIQNYHFTSKGELVFGLKLDSGSMIFR